MAGQKNKFAKAGVVLFLLLPLLVQGQSNLVLNYSFEDTVCGGINTNCGASTIKFWTAPTGGSPDIFDTCQPSCYGCYGIPLNGEGWQYPRSGLQYAGFVMLNYKSSGDGYEYLEGQLKSSLNGGKEYCVTYYVSLADSAWYAVSDLGAYLSSFQVCKAGIADTLPYIPQILNPVTNILSDKVDWVPVSGEFLASGGEHYITIGRFDSIGSYIYVGNGGKTWQSPCCATYYYTDDVSVRELAIAHAGHDTSICSGQQALLGADSAVPGGSYYWQPTTGLAEPNSAQTLAAPSVTTTYTLTVVNDSTKGCNCPDSVNSSTVTVYVCKEPLFVPTAFSPNNDGQNDVFLIKGNYVKDFDMVIYDRWGNKVFESNNINDGWDGTYKGQPEDAGTYVYYLKGTYTDGTNFEKKGNVALVR